MLEKWSKMSAREVMIALVGRQPTHGELPRWLKNVSEMVGISFRTARSLWNDEIKNPGHWAIKKIKQEAEIADARTEDAALANQYQDMAGGLRATDENFYRADIDRLERLVRIIGCLDRS